MPTNSAAIDCMNSTTPIPLNRARRLLEKARAFVADMERFLDETALAVTILLDALPYADSQLLLKMLPLLGYAGKDRVLWPLYHLVLAASKDEQVRHSAAIQLGLAASLSDDPSALREALIEKLSHPDAAVRSHCALALGWEGNLPAVAPLMAHLTDPNRDVQAAMVTALSSVGDRRVFDNLTVRMRTGSQEQQRCILLNLWRFAESIPRVADNYIAYLEKISPDLVPDALAGIAMLPVSASVLKGYRRLLTDSDPRIRRQVLENLSLKDPADFAPLQDTIVSLLTDKDDRVRQAAVRLIANRSRL